MSATGVRGWFSDGRAADRSRIGDLTARFLGAATATYAAATLARPSVLARPLRMGTSPATDTLARAVGVRDLASGVAMVAATGHAGVVASAMRIGSDLGDAVVFGLSDLPADARRKAVGVALGWAALNSAALALRLGAPRRG
ncbi:hypothetical protein [Pseudonocardia sp.]|uniref:hypothetical protein n=1 Tax=Pseudonocardia sp. TaxID=60912 RepID=UPI003D0EB2BB